MADKEKVIYLVDETERCEFITPHELLKELVAEETYKDCNAMIVIGLNINDGGFMVEKASYSKIKYSQVIAGLEIAKANLLKEMVDGNAYEDLSK